MHRLRISVIIPTYKDWDRLAICLAALSLQTLPQDDFEVVIADNDPGSPIPSDFRLPKNAQLIRVDQPGSYAARNAALEVAKSGTLAFTDADCVPDPNWLMQALELFAAQPSISRIAGDVRFFVEDGRWTAAALYDRTFTLQQQRFSREGKSATANAFAYRAVFDAIGLFDPKLLTGGDHEWSQRAQNAGYKLAFCPQSVVGHPARSSFAQILLKTRRFAGGSIARKRQRGDRVILPNFDNIVPPFRRGYLLCRSKDLTYWQALRIWALVYGLRVAFLVEQLRILVLRGRHERL